ncbi:MAG: dihydroorotase [Lachnospiraceae bacterium]|nr:dihydroorotase [Lachnospiraceae bacterium]
MKKILIINGKVVNPEGKSGQLDILIEGGTVKCIAEAGSISDTVTCDAEDIKVIDASGCIVSPGFVDVHTHFRDPGQTHKEDIFTGAEAAKRGGYTSVVLMANTVPAVDNAETLAYVLERGRQTGINIYSCTNVTLGMQGKELVDMASLKEAGAAGFTDDGRPLMDVELVKKAMEICASLGMILSFHEEDPAYIKNNGINHGRASEHFGIYGSDREAEISMIRRDIELALETGAEIDIQHISTAEGVELVREARKKSAKIHAEATPHHFSLTEDAAIKYGTLAKMNPPLRTEADRLAIAEGLRDGTIEMIATDHAPHSAEEKAKAVTEAPSGIIGLETMLPLAMMNLVEPGTLSMEQFVERASCGPAKVYRLDAGVIREGAQADICIFDPEEKWIAGDYRSKSANSPFTGQEMRGKVKWTICRGRIVNDQPIDQ